MKKITLTTITLMSLMAFVGCDKKKEDILPPGKAKADIPSEETSVTDNSTPENVTSGEGTYTSSCGGTTVDLLAGQHIKSGEVTINDDGEFVYVTFSTQDNWELNHTHVYVGALEDLPGYGGNPQIGNFPYQSGHDPLESSVTYSVPIASLGDDQCFVVATHAEVVRPSTEAEGTDEETAWGEGSQINDGGSWAMYTDYCLCEDNADDEGSTEDDEEDTGDDELPPIMN